MDIAIIGAGINGLCIGWELAKNGHGVTIYERDTVVAHTSSASSKLLHGGLRYLENGEFRLVAEALQERQSWFHRAPTLAKPLRLTLPIYSHSNDKSAMPPRHQACSARERSIGP
jgi:glycerol-3-phosphate dehydrogenase